MHFQQKSFLEPLKCLFKISICGIIRAQKLNVHSYVHPLGFHRRVSLTVIHLTDLDHVFVCRATLDSIGDVDNRSIYSNSHHFHWDGYGFSSEDSSVQNLRVLKREKEKINTTPVEGVGRALNNSSQSQITSSERVSSTYSDVNWSLLTKQLQNSYHSWF